MHHSRPYSRYLVEFHSILTMSFEIVLLHVVLLTVLNHYKHESDCELIGQMAEGISLIFKGQSWHLCSDITTIHCSSSYSNMVLSKPLADVP